MTADDSRAEVLSELIALISATTPHFKQREQVRGAEWVMHMAEAELESPGHLRRVTVGMVDAPKPRRVDPNGAL